MFQKFVQHFQTLEYRPFERMVFLVIGLLLFWIIEGSIPLIQLNYKKSKLRHALVNFGFTLIHLVIHTGLAVVIVLLADWVRQREIGLVHWLHASVVTTIVISVLALDFFGGWLVHFTQHKFYPLWKFHVVHHADNNVDVTTGLRHHPIESLLRGVFFMIGIIVAGAPMYGVMMYQTLLILATAFTHANISLPCWMDKSLSYIIISPNMHKVHHHYKQPYTDSNYGAVFAIWDRLLGTFMKLEPKDIKYGLDRYYPNEKDEDFLLLLKRPFQDMKES